MENRKPIRIAHVALWTTRLEELKDFYVQWLDAIAGQKYVNSAKGFESYFLSFGDGASLEIMRSRDVVCGPGKKVCTGFCHLAFSVESRSKVVELTERMRSAGYDVPGEPRVTGDGFFESVVCDPDGNRIELVAE